MSKDKRPVMDSGVLPGPRDTPYVAGGKDQGSLADRKGALLNTGRIGYVPGHDEFGRGSSLRAGHVHEAPPQTGRVPGDDELMYAPVRWTMPRDRAISSTPTHMGNLTRFADGHSEIIRERPHLVEQLSDPDVSPDRMEQIRTEIAHRDAINLHKWW